MKTFSELVENFLTEAVPTMSVKDGSSTTSGINLANTSTPLFWNALLTRRGDVYIPKSRKEAIRSLWSLVGEEQAENFYDKFKNYTELLYKKRKQAYDDTIFDAEATLDQSKNTRPYTELELTRDALDHMLKPFPPPAAHGGWVPDIPFQTSSGPHTYGYPEDAIPCPSGWPCIGGGNGDEEDPELDTGVIDVDPTAPVDTSD